MDIEALTIPLQSAAETVPPEHGGNRETDPLRAWIALRNPKVDPEALSALVTELRALPELALFDGKMQVLANSASRVDYESLAKWLVLRVLQAGVERALDDLRRYVTEPTFECQRIKALGGIEVEGPVPLGNGITLIPFSSVPDCFPKRVFEYPSLRSFPIFGPSAALVQTLVHPRVHLDPDEKLPEPLTKLAYSHQLEHARLCLTLVGPSGPASYGSWLNAEDRVPCMPGAGMGFATVIELGGEHRRLEASEYKRAREILELFLRLDPDRQARLRVPLGRLNLAIRRDSIVDSAIDLRIAMEAAFLDDLEDDRELSYRLRIRAARVLEADERRRRDLYRTFGLLYRLCSRAVHKGTVPEKYKGDNSKALLEEGIRHTARAIELAICRPGLDWLSVTLS